MKLVFEFQFLFLEVGHFDLLGGCQVYAACELLNPSVERSVKEEADYVRFAGEKAKLKLKNAHAGQKVVVGVLGALDNGVVSVQASVQDGGRTYEIPLEDIASARLVFEFGPASKPGKPGGSGPKSQHPKSQKKSGGKR